VAKGFSQIHGIDFDKTYVPVAKFVLIKTMLALGAILDFEIHQMDVKCAFLNGELSEEVYDATIYVSRTKQAIVCKLKKSIFRLEQSQRVWNTTIHKFSKGTDSLGVSLIIMFM
jgi:DNA polymerase zeta